MEGHGAAQECQHITGHNSHPRTPGAPPTMSDAEQSPQAATATCPSLPGTTDLARGMRRKRSLKELQDDSASDGVVPTMLAQALAKCAAHDYDFELATQECRVAELKALCKAAGYPVGRNNEDRRGFLQKWSEGKAYAKGRRRVLRNGETVALAAKQVRESVTLNRRR